MEHRIALGEDHHTALGEVGRRIHEVLGILPAEDHHIGAAGLQGLRIAVLGGQGRRMPAQGGRIAHSGYTEDWAMASRAHHIGQTVDGSQTAGVSHNHNSAVAENLVSVFIVCH